ncbi:aminopeptidase P family protein [Zobellia galactanivorans]|uniref:Xaa-Pro aminopeptidase n=1 Tax=Zobellia galactanivorans (strain DSM 12802 / CCUG 47099 / CIP 106680 / NCIMB 13871 / Dsij) TaxID=63186 RepID=G0L8M6_ZOBGA|nr:aminopeptidase P family protein [Zobellia galactanivorans]CAZ97687.1 Aminopeptidase, family M24 [Zobellia galactanivorans]
MFSTEEYIARRAKLKELMGSGLVLLMGNEEVGINFEDNIYPFRQDSSFLYFFGIQTNGLAAIIDLESGEELIFGDDPSIDHIVFSGPIESLQSQAAKVGVTHVKSGTDLSDYLGEAVSKGKKVHYLPPYRAEHALKLTDLLHVPTSKLKEQSSTELIKAIVQLRTIKSEAEVVEIEKALNVTVDMHYKAMEMAQPLIKESDVYGAVSQIALAKGVGTSFPPIVTINGQILHNHYRGNELKEGDMLLCDCGAEIASGYAGDLTRTFPVSKKFSKDQKEIYNIVFEAYSTAVALLKPGRLFLDVHLAACEKIVEGLIAFGLMKGNAKEAVAEGAHTMFFQCGLGHMLGLDVHDMENLGEQYVGYTDTLKQRTDFGFRSLRLGRALEEGMVVTVEPGIYIIPELIDLRKKEGKYLDFVNYEMLEKYRDFGGIRIEDVFLITPEEGGRILGNRLPGSAAEIEEFMLSHQRL